MDDSWRTPIGSVVPRQRSTGQPRAEGGGGGLDPDDFRDVFGGPPRTVLLRRFSGGDLASSSSSSSFPATSTSDFDRLHRCHRRRPSFYEEVFRRQMPAGPQESETGRRLPDFTIPDGDRAGKTEGFSDGIPFGRRSRTRSRQSKSNSSSVLSWEEQDGGGEPSGPRRPWIAGDDGALSSFASKLRPIAVPSRRSPTSPCRQIGSRHGASPTGLQMEGSVAGANFFRRPYSPGEAIVNVELKIPPTEAGDESGSDCSAISSDYDIPMATITPLAKSGKKLVVMPGEEDERAGSSYVIEIVPRGKAAEERGSMAVEEAIAWAKERLQ